jgi:hypothetical protein
LPRARTGMRHLVVCVVLLAGCPDRTIAEAPPVQTGAITKDIPASADIDILFVIDNSASTNDKQVQFAANFPRFIDALNAFPTGFPNVHIGVVSSSVDIGNSVFGPQCSPASGQNGSLQNRPFDGICAAPTDRFLVDVAVAGGTRQVNYPGGDLAASFSCIAQLGAAGCGFEAPLAAMQRALDGSRPENAGFLRRGAFLAVVILTDEDDCSADDLSLFTRDQSVAGPNDLRCAIEAYQCDRSISPGADGTYTGCKPREDGALATPSSFATFLTSIKDSQRIVVALIGGDRTSTIETGPLTISGSSPQERVVQPSCMATINSVLQVARPANRLAAFVDAFASQGLFRTVCESDYSQALADIGKLIGDSISPCLNGKLDTRDRDPANPGLQPDCTVSELTNVETPDEDEVAIPRCAMADATTPAPGGERPCWWVAADATTCPDADHLELHVERANPNEAGTDIRVSCATGN